ncbi:MAG: DUF2232 domain-containing protein [Gammaproteobacteria bacterium]|nr:MAG: DUF2232 domain-containing protein [Gammaproteobacteria bacterium]
MQAVAAWLVARPLNSALALAATISLAYLSFLSGVIMVLLVLRKGPKAALVDAAIAGGLLAAIGLVQQAPLVAVLSAATIMWLPAMLLGVLLISTRSLTLTLQVSVIVAVSAIIGFYLVAGDLADFWRVILLEFVEVSRQLGMTEQAELLEGQIDAVASQMTTIAALSIWVVQSINCILGYLLYRELPGETVDCGRFSDLSFGRVIASVMAIASIAAVFSDGILIQNIAFVLFLVFWLQGLAVVHWMHGAGKLPVFAVIAVYVLMPFLNIILLMALAVVGYIDTWFRLRRPRATVS